MYKNNKRVIRQGILGFYNLLLRPRSLEEDDQRRELILNIILIGSIVFLTILEMFLVVEWLRWIFFQIPFSGIPVYVFTTVYLLFVFLYKVRRSLRCLGLIQMRPSA